MIGNLASRQAGRSLQTVIGMLLLPLLIFGTIYFQKSNDQIHVIDKELVGIKIGQLVFPVLLSEAHEASEQALVEISELEASLGISPNVGFASHLKFSSRKLDADHDLEEQELKKLGAGHEHKESISGYIKDITDKSGIILDNEATTFYLGYALMVQLPDLLLNFELLMGNSGENQVIDSSDIRSFARFQKILGRTLEGVKGLAASVASATNYSETPERFSELQELVDRMEKGVTEVVEVAGAAVVVPTILPSAAKKPAVVEGQELFLQSQKFTMNGFQHMESLLQERRSSLTLNLYWMLALALGAASISLTLAYRMVRYTLHKLDVVEDARNEAIRINEEVAALNKDLAVKISMLNNAQDEIVKKGKMEQLGHLTATIAHELRNPLGSVRTSAFLIQRKVEGKNIGIDSQLERINNGIQRCDDTITQLLDYSRAKKVTPVPTHLDEWLEKIVTEESLLLPQTFSIECSLGLNDRLVPIDAARLQRAVINLISNAVEAFAGGSTDKAKTIVTEPKLWISTRIAGEFAVIKVQDNGPGISEANLARIREPLFTTKNFGTGLGIPAIEQIADHHNGRLEITSVLGSGASFEMFLPLDCLDLEDEEAA
jgi:signal transduction histidine kinase